MDFQNSSILIGLAIDLSGSMEESIRNDIDEKMSRLKSAGQALQQFTKDARSSVQKNRQAGQEVAVRIFAYGFGLTLPDREIGDLLALSKIDPAAQLRETPSFETGGTPGSSGTGYQELEKIINSYGYEYRLIDFAKNYLSESDAGKLARELEKDQSSASKLVELIPKNSLMAGLKFGFQKTVNFVPNLVGREVTRDDAQEAQNLAFELIARADSSSVEATRSRIIGDNKRKISNRVDEIGDVTLPIEEIADLWERHQVGNIDIEQIKELIYGGTPMQEALDIISRRFDRELPKLPPNTRSFLFILSDGQPTDGDPLPLANRLREKGVTIISCFVTNEDITEPRMLFDQLNPDWTDAAKLMFNMASGGKDTSQMAQFLKERKWIIRPGAKTFVQVNHSEILEEFLQGLLSLVKGTV